MSTPPLLNGGYQTPSNSLDALNHDITNLIASARIEFASNPYDQGVQQRLKALLDLQSILGSQVLPSDQLGLIRDQVAQLSLASRPPPTPIPPAAAPILQQTPPQPTPNQPPVSLHSLFPPNALAALLASVSPPPQPTPPPPPPAVLVSQPSSYHVSVPAPSTPSVPAGAPQVPGESSLLASLRAAGMLPPLSSAATATPPLPTAYPAHLPPPPVPMGSSGQLPNGLTALALSNLANDAELTSASIKMCVSPFVTVPRHHYHQLTLSSDLGRIS